VAFLLGSVRTLEFDGNAVVAAIWALLATILAQVLFSLGAPQGSFLDVSLATLGSAVLNGALAVPLYGLLARILPGTS
jgi:hypothetical protein